ncbi:MAG: hypothetical protein IPH96_13325 [Saprospiraceae bacterium]|nr:hypothetical protein [Saprospiraceae bacterium]
MMSGVVNICDTLLINPNNPLASVDCDGDGMTNLEECLKSTLPGDPCECDVHTSRIMYLRLSSSTSPLALEDCDKGGIINPSRMSEWKQSMIQVTSVMRLCYSKSNKSTSNSRL